MFLCRIWLLTLMVGAITALAPRLAHACACCGSEQRVQVRGWSAKGDAVAIHRYTEATCDRREVLEIWKVGASEPAQCFSAYSQTPDVAIPCRKVEGVDPNGAIVDEPKPLSLPPGFAQGAQQLPSRVVMGWSPLEFQEGEDRLHMDVMAGGRFVAIDLLGYDAANEDTTPSAVAIWISPRGRNAIVLIEQLRYDDDSEVGVAWTKLPRGVDRSLATTEAAWAPTQVPPQAPDPDQDRDWRGALAGRALARGRVYQRLGDHDEAVAQARIATQKAPSRIDAWVALSRWLIAAGDPDQAWALLQRVGALPCPSCRALVREQLGNPGFDAIRGRPGFAALGGKR